MFLFRHAKAALARSRNESKVSFYHPKMTLSMCARNSAYVFWYMTDIPTDQHIYIYTRKMVPITGRASSFIVFFDQNREVGDRTTATDLSIYSKL